MARKKKKEKRAEKTRTRSAANWHYNGETVLVAAFQVLVDFVREKPFDGTDYWDDKRYCQAKSEIVALFDWWIVVRPGRRWVAWNYSVVPGIDDCDDAEIIAAWDRHCEQRNRVTSEWIEEDDAMFVRLVNVRWAIWS